MAADVNPYHNDLFGVDVDGDVWLSPRDALLVINDLNTNGPRSLLASGSAGGEGETTAQTSSYKIDVSGDGFVSPQDALQVINLLNGEGEGEVVQFGLKATSLTSTAAVTTFQVGDHFRLSVSASDLRSGGGGVFAAYLDVPYTANVRRVIRENQEIKITGAPDDGSFTLTFNGQTTAPITYDPANSLPTTSTIRTALENLSNIDPGEVEVSNGSSPGSSWIVKFGGARYGDTNVPNMTGSGTFNGGSSPGVTVTELPGSVAVPGQADSIVRSTSFSTNYLNGLSARDGEGSDPNVLDEIGGFGSTTPIGLGAKVVFTEEFVALGSGTATFASNGAEDSPGHDVLVYGSDLAVPDTQIIYPSLDITINRLVTAVDDPASATEDQTTATRINVLSNDSVVSGTKQIQSFTQPANGTVTKFTNNTTTPTDDQLDYKPNANFFGTDTFTYVLTDGNGNTGTATVTVTVAGVNDGPTLTAPTSVATTEDTAVSFTAANAISIADIDAGSAAVVTTLSATNGTLTLASTAGLNPVTGNGTGSISMTGSINSINAALNGLTFTPILNFSGSSTLTTTVNDNGNTGTGGAKSASKTTTISISAVNDAPVINLPAGQAVTEGTTLVLSTGNGNAVSVSDVDAGSANVVTTLSVTHGTLTLASITGLNPVTGNGTGSISMTGPISSINSALNGMSYTPATNFVGDETLSISTNDQGNSGSGGNKITNASLAITVNPNIRPRANNDSATVDEDSSNNLISVLGNDIANIGGVLILKSTTAGAHGTTSVDDNGTPGNTGDDKVKYTPNSDYFGSDTFTYTVNDSTGQGADSTATVTVTVREKNDAPVPVDDPRTTNEDTPLTIVGSTLSSNDSPGPNESAQTLTVTAVSAGSAQGGTVVLSNGSIVYAPAANFNGTDTFTYTVTDNGTTFGASDPKSATGTVTVTVTAVNDAPEAHDDSASGVEDQPVTVTFSSLLSNDSPGGGTDEAGQQLTVTAVAATSSAGGAVIADQQQGRFVFSPAADFNGVCTITYTVQDNGTPPQSATGTVTVTLSEVNDPPTAVDDHVTAVKNAAKTYSAAALLGNDSKGPANESGQTLTIIAVDATSAQGGVVVLNNDGTVTYTPPANLVGDDSFHYTMRDNGTTAGDSAFLQSSATVFIDVLDYIPMTVSGYVYFDLNGDGARQSSEPGMGGVEVVLTGTDFEQQPVGPLTAVTDRNGKYEFTELAPGNYHIREAQQPANTIDGQESVSAPLFIESNDALGLNVTVEDNVALPSPVLTENNFGERGVTSPFASVFLLLASSAGSTAELPQGILFSYNDTAAQDQDWYHFLDGWDNFLSAKLQLAGDRQSAVLTVVTNSNQTLQATITADSARLRVRTDAAGHVIVQVVGDPSDFLLAQAQIPQGEGEGDVPAYEDAVMLAARGRTDPTTSQVIQAVDAALAASENWV